MELYIVIIADQLAVLRLNVLFKRRESSFDTTVQDPLFLLDKDGSLKQKDIYYAQVQMFVHNVSYCDLVVLINSLVIVRVQKYDVYCGNLIDNPM